MTEDLNRLMVVDADEAQERLEELIEAAICGIDLHISVQGRPVGKLLTVPPRDIQL